MGGREKRVKKGCRMTPAVKVARHYGEGLPQGPELQLLLSPQSSSQPERSLSVWSHTDKAGHYLQWDGRYVHMDCSFGMLRESRRKREREDRAQGPHTHACTHARTQAHTAERHLATLRGRGRESKKANKRAGWVGGTQLSFRPERDVA